MLSSAISFLKLYNAHFLFEFCTCVLFTNIAKISCNFVVIIIRGIFLLFV